MNMFMFMYIYNILYGLLLGYFSDSRHQHATENALQDLTQVSDFTSLPSFVGAARGCSIAHEIIPCTSSSHVFRALYLDGCTEALYLKPDMDEICSEPEDDSHGCFFLLERPQVMPDYITEDAGDPAA